MRGHTELVNARAARASITLVAVSLTGAPPDSGMQFITESGYSFIEVEPTDNARALDLRGVCGLDVVLLGHGDARWLEVLERLQLFEPTSIATHTGEFAARWTKQSGLREIAR